MGLQYTKLAWFIWTHGPIKGEAHLYLLSQKLRGTLYTMSQKRRGSNTMSQKWRGSFVHTVPKIAWLICTALFQKWRGSFVQWLYTLSQKWRGLFVHTVPKMAWLICTHCSKNGAAHLYSRSKKLSESPHKTETDPMLWFMFGFSGFCVRYTLYVQRMWTKSYIVVSDVWNSACSGTVAQQ